MSTIRKFTASGAIAAYRFVQHGAEDGLAIQAANGTSPLLGVADELGHADGEAVDVHRLGRCLIEYGGAVTRGQPLTANADGKAIAAAPAAGVNTHIGGFADVSGVAGDIVEFVFTPSVLQGAA